MSRLFHAMRIVLAGVVASALLVPAANALVITSQVRDMIDFETGEPVKGVATLTRMEDEIWAFVSTSGLDSMAAYTMWWVVFNNPAGCEIVGGCGLSDEDFEPDSPAQTAVLWANGWISDMDGFATFSAHLHEGAAYIPGEDLLGNNIGLLDSFFAEVHIVLRVHYHDDGSPILPGEFAEAVRTFNGGCPMGIGCYDQQFAIFPPIPVPAAVWLFGSALGLLGWMRRRQQI